VFYLVLNVLRIGREIRQLLQFIPLQRSKTSKLWLIFRLWIRSFEYIRFKWCF